MHGIVSGILLLPYFRQPPAPLGCDKIILRWPGPFGSGFLSPQPPGAVGIGSVRRGSNPENWANASWSFFFLGICFRTTPLVIPQRASASFDVQLHIRESITTIVSMDCGPAPNGASRNDEHCLLCRDNYRSGVKAAPSIGPGFSRLPSWT